MTGSGTEGDPYIITTAADLQAIEDDLDAYYELAGNVDASATSTWNANAGFLPITAFSGQLDGKGYAVSSLFISRGNVVIGLINTNSGTVKNLGMTSVSMTGLIASIGAIAGYNTGTISNCYSTGTLTANGTVGGITQWNDGGTIDQCYSTCTIDTSGGTHSDAGGLVEWNDGTITNSYARGSLTGGAGAFAEAGGFVQLNSGTIDDCYSTGALTGYTGGTAGFCQANTGTITNCFWDTETSGEAASDGGTGKTTAEMKINHTFFVAGWNFSTIWKIDSAVNNGYPSLGQITSIGRRYIWVEGPSLHYFDDYGNERKILGEPVAAGLPIYYFF